ncbi:hypothetical protein ZIOFF_047768 [Zingiber officinale]|uniref:cAMP-regulated phosphoprotein 19-related protein n=1 Tax=Zingiber officinale TaxID=94328 RepID=A0A8J5FXY9_ZINOF|nr:hypothetical protein ZIOFF_047768 [Zingiber officinale]
MLMAVEGRRSTDRRKGGRLGLQSPMKDGEVLGLTAMIREAEEDGEGVCDPKAEAAAEELGTAMRTAGGSTLFAVPEFTIQRVFYVLSCVSFVLSRRIVEFGKTRRKRRKGSPLPPSSASLNSRSLSRRSVYLELFMSNMDAGENLNQTEANEMPSSEQEVRGSNQEEVWRNCTEETATHLQGKVMQDHERAYFDSADWALGKQGAEKPKGPLEALRPKLQPTQQQTRSRRSAYASSDNKGDVDDGGNATAEEMNEDIDSSGILH